MRSYRATALQAQSTAFDEQLAVLEGIRGPLAEWGKTWAQFERLVMNAGRDPGVTARPCTGRWPRAGCAQTRRKAG